MTSPPVLQDSSVVSQIPLTDPDPDPDFDLNPNLNADLHSDPNSIPIVVEQQQLVKNTQEFIHPVTVLYPFNSEQEGDLVLTAGSEINVLKTREDGWWFGHTLDDPNTLGWFPSNYVKKAHPQLQLQLDQPQVSQPIDAICTHSFTSRESTEMSIVKGERLTLLIKHSDGWCEGSNMNGETGSFPLTHVQEINPENDEDDSVGYSSGIVSSFQDIQDSLLASSSTSASSENISNTVNEPIFVSRPEVLEESIILAAPDAVEVDENPVQEKNHFTSNNGTTSESTAKSIKDSSLFTNPERNQVVSSGSLQAVDETSGVVSASTTDAAPAATSSSNSTNDIPSNATSPRNPPLTGPPVWVQDYSPVPDSKYLKSPGNPISITWANPMPIPPQQSVITWGFITISEPHTQKKGFSKFTAYKVHNSLSNASVLRRYSDFDWLCTHFIHRYPWLILPNLPKKKYTGRFQLSFIHERVRALQRWLIYVCSHPLLKHSPLLRLFLVTQNPKKFESVKRNSPAPKAPLSISSKEPLPNPLDSTYSPSNLISNEKLLVHGMHFADATTRRNSAMILNGYKRHLSRWEKILSYLLSNLSLLEKSISAQAETEKLCASGINFFRQEAHNSQYGESFSDFNLFLLSERKDLAESQSRSKKTQSSLFTRIFSASNENESELEKSEPTLHAPIGFSKVLDQHQTFLFKLQTMIREPLDFLRDLIHQGLSGLTQCIELYESYHKTVNVFVSKYVKIVPSELIPHTRALESSWEKAYFLVSIKIPILGGPEEQSENLARLQTKCRETLTKYDELSHVTLADLSLLYSAISKMFHAKSILYSQLSFENYSMIGDHWKTLFRKFGGTNTLIGQGQTHTTLFNDQDMEDDDFVEGDDGYQEPEQE